MQLSAEIRWFWAGDPPAGLKEWFLEAKGDVCAAGGGERERQDQYLRDENQVQLGIKRRDTKSSQHKGVEVKGLVAAKQGMLAAGPFVGPIELWAKWGSESLAIDEGSTVTIRKQRWLRKFDGAASPPREIEVTPNEQPGPGQTFPNRGCNVELTRIGVEGLAGTWWTLGFESFGALATVEADLRAAAAVLSERWPPGLEGGRLASYPAWLKADILPELKEVEDRR